MKKKTKSRIVVMGSNAAWGTCTGCNKKKQELRPYGKDGAMICFDCGEKDEKTTLYHMRKFLDGGD
jgi:hypothetical protein